MVSNSFDRSAFWFDLILRALLICCSCFFPLFFRYLTFCMLSFFCCWCCFSLCVLIWWIGSSAEGEGSRNHGAGLSAVGEIFRLLLLLCICGNRYCLLIRILWLNCSRILIECVGFWVFVRYLFGLFIAWFYGKVEWSFAACSLRFFCFWWFIVSWLYEPFLRIVELCLL